MITDVSPKNLIHKPDLNYRALDKLNYSSLKDYDDDPLVFFETYIQGNVKKKKKSTALLLGSLCNDMILKHKGDMVAFEQDFDERYSLFGEEVGDKQVFVLADILFDLYCREVALHGEAAHFTDARFEEACRIIQEKDRYKGKTVKYIFEDFVKNSKEYYDLNVSSIGKEVVTLGLLEKARIMAEKALRDPFLQNVLQLRDTHNQWVYTEHPIQFTYQGIECKAELDILTVNHVKKTIQPDDLKTAHDNSRFSQNYLKYKYYLQQAWYYLAVKRWQEENDLQGYTILPFRFITLDSSTNLRRPLVYTLQEKHLQQGLNGFTHQGVKYRGIFELLENIAWNNQTGQWDVNKAHFEANGQITLEVFE